MRLTAADHRVMEEMRAQHVIEGVVFSARDYEAGYDLETDAWTFKDRAATTVRDELPLHFALQSLEGQRVRVTIEVLPD